MRSFKITLGDPAPTAILVESSADGSTGWTQTDSVAVGALTDLGEGFYRLDAANAPTDQYVRLIPSDGTLTASPNKTYPPVPGPATETVLFVNEKTWGALGQAPKVGAVLRAEISGASSGGGFVNDSGPFEDTTDANGYAALTLPRGATVLITLSGTSIRKLQATLSTATVDLATLV